MNTFRRCLVAALFLLTCVFLLRSSHRNAQPTAQLLPDAIRKDPHLRETLVNQEKLQLIPPEDLARRPLRERLRYHFPYDLESKFPAYIWQTWKYTPASPSFDEDFRPLEASWTEQHPGFVHQVIDDKTAIYVIKYLYSSVPEVLEAYSSLPLPVLRADFFRYLILLARGGIYSDIDTYVLQPAMNWIPKTVDPLAIGLVIGIEADPDREDWAQWYSRRIQFCQWTIQSKPGHPVLRDAVATITEEVMRMKAAGKLTKSKMDKSIIEFTGPAMWTDAIFRYFNNPAHFDIGGGGENKKTNITALDFTGMKAHKKVGDVVVLPITSFSPGVNHMGAGDTEDPMAFVLHEFQGTWKPPTEKDE